MTRFRLIMATVVALAMVSLGAVACTPEQQTEFREGPIATLVGGVIAWTVLNYLSHPGQPAP